MLHYQIMLTNAKGLKINRTCEKRTTFDRCFLFFLSFYAVFRKKENLQSTRLDVLKSFKRIGIYCFGTTRLI